MCLPNHPHLECCLQSKLFTGRERKEWAGEEGGGGRGYDDMFTRERDGLAVNDGIELSAYLEIPLCSCHLKQPSTLSSIDEFAMSDIVLCL